MAKQFTYTDPSGNQYSAAYAILSNVAIDKLGEQATLTFSIFKDQASRQALKQPIGTFQACIGEPNFDAYFGLTALTGSNPYKQGYLAYDAVGANNFFAVANAQDV